METEYSNREIDAKFDSVHERFDRQDVSIAEILKNVRYTNGKVKKVIIALVLVGGVLLGLTGKEIVVPVLLKIL